MEFNDDAGLDTSQVEDLRSSGGGVGGRVLLGGGGLGVVGLIIYFVMSQFGGGLLDGGSTAAGISDVSNGGRVDNARLSQECKTGRDANTKHDCALVAVINSVQGYWKDEFARSGRTYQQAPTNFFRGNVNTACGGATSDVGPFYCPGDSEVYVDLSFFQELQTRFGAEGGTFVEAYVLAHEYGHHVQNLLGTSDRVRTRRGPTSDAVRLELQADCYAGVWANHATTTPTSSGQPLIKSISQDDIRRALDAASRIGDDFIQRELGGGRVDESQFTHGTSAQREKWFTTGIKSGNPANCDTFKASNLG
ncbi:putative metalloprotease [Kibdelosporangium banguiense]|uniref:Metalloprotease n=1 Tax=Kibdelosporangium banguiense TaxID=1365924 RepID=A0ABS4TCE5_9PSEU|nr:neutral zinc metallopeptidase [Kibdelosporangium banguiense]MBP2321624.1 putative metalloprotease [Kibdelosporangium banguiense]